MDEMIGRGEVLYSVSPVCQRTSQGIECKFCPRPLSSIQQKKIEDLLERAVKLLDSIDDHLKSIENNTGYSR